jgi:tetratricopeptide (TPR) repeat protein
MINLFNILKKKEKAVSVLDEFLKQIPSNEHLDANESRRNLEENLVELTYYGHHSSNGLLFSGRGYFLTAKHCVEDIEDLNRLRARLYNGETYNIKKICAVSNKSDIAIGKIDLPRRYNPKMFKIYNTDKLEKIPVVLLTRVNGKIKENGILKNLIQ